MRAGEPSAYDLDEVRRRVRQQQARADEINRRSGLLAAEVALPGQWDGLVLRCTKKHSGGKSPKVAEVRRTHHGTFFTADIPWAHSDSETLRPWIEESHLSNLMRGEHLDDDELLVNALKTLDWWRDRGPGDISWMAQRSARAHRIVEILDLPSTAGQLTLWVRCPLHVDDFEAIEATRLIEAMR